MSDNATLSIIMNFLQAVRFYGILVIITALLLQPSRYGFAGHLRSGLRIALSRGREPGDIDAAFCWRCCVRRWKSSAGRTRLSPPHRRSAPGHRRGDRESARRRFRAGIRFGPRLSRWAGCGRSSGWRGSMPCRSSPAARRFGSVGCVMSGSDAAKAPHVKGRTVQAYAGMKIRLKRELADLPHPVRRPHRRVLRGSLLRQRNRVLREENGLVS